MGTETTSIDEPAAPDQSIAAGSASSPKPPAPTPPTAPADALRALACALLVGGCVASPEAAPLIAPFVPAVVAIRLLRQRAGARRFLATALLASVGTAALAATAPSDLPWALVLALLLVGLLGFVHGRAALHDPVDAPAQDEWPEPRLRTGLSLAIGGWALALVMLGAVAAPSIGSLRELGGDVVRDAYSLYTRECRDGGALAERAEFCDQILAQRDGAIELVDEHAPELLAGLLALFAWGAAATAHPIVVARSRHASSRVRPTWRLRELEVHWVSAYLVAAGLGLWMLAAGDTAIEQALRVVGVGVGTLGALLVVTQGVGLLAWLLTRGRTPGWYRAFLVVAALFIVPVALVLLFLLGVVDLALHPRRRAAKSASLPGRGSGS